MNAPEALHHTAEKNSLFINASAANCIRKKLLRVMPLVRPYAQAFFKGSHARFAAQQSEYMHIMTITVNHLMSDGSAFAAILNTRTDIS
jgi:hypothetical protein